MAENLAVKIRCIGIDTADVITTETGIATAAWTEEPLTLRDDELSITPGDVTEDEVFSHENDIPEDYDVTGTGSTAVGSFILASLERMVNLIGGKVSGSMFIKSGKISILNKAIRFRLKNGDSIIIPNARGYVDFSANMGATDGRLKLPFNFKSMAQADFDCDLIYVKAATAQGTSAPLVAPTETTTEEKTVKSSK